MSYSSGSGPSSISSSSDVALNNPANGQTLSYNGTTQKWQNATPVAVGGSTNPFVVTPGSTSTDIGALINSAFATYDCVAVAAGSWSLTTTILIDTGQTLMGFGWGASRITAKSGLGANPMIAMANGSSANFTICDLEINGASIATYGFYGYATDAPSGADVSPDFTPIFENFSIYGATVDGFYIGGSYSGGLRESRILNCKSKHNGQYGFNVSSSDCFMANCTSHGNGSSAGGYLINGGNVKLMQCKAYYENIGFNLTSERVVLTGCEAQDCLSYGIQSYGSNKIDAEVDTCGDASTAAVYINGSGCTLTLHCVTRTAPRGNTPTYALRLSSNSNIVVGLMNIGGYPNAYANANRPATGSNFWIG